MVKPGGRVASLEFCVPPSPFWHAAWWLYTRLVLPLGGLLTGGREWFFVGRFLGPNISRHYRKYPVAWTEQAWRDAGFTDVGTRLMSLGRRAGHVGNQVRWLNRRPGRPTTPPVLGRCGTGGPCCIRRLQPGTCRTSCSERCWRPQVRLDRLVAALLAFFLAVGLAAHALDELHGRPLRTAISRSALIAVTAAGLAGAVGLGAVGISRVGWGLLPFMIIGPLLVVGYNAELFGGLIHTDLGFAAAWGAFPALTGYVAEAGRLAVAPVVAAGAAMALSAGQRHLSTPARILRRRTSTVTGSITLYSGEVTNLDAAGCLNRWNGRCVLCHGAWYCLRRHWRPRGWHSRMTWRWRCEAAY